MVGDLTECLGQSRRTTRGSSASTRTCVARHYAGSNRRVGRLRKAWQSLPNGSNDLKRSVTVPIRGLPAVSGWRGRRTLRHRGGLLGFQTDSRETALSA